MKIINSEFKGMKFKKFISEKKYDGLFCLEDYRFRIIGIPKLFLSYDSYKFPQELCIELCSHKDNSYSKEKRNNSKWNTIEIHIPFDEAKLIIEALYKELQK